MSCKKAIIKILLLKYVYSHELTIWWENFPINEIILLKINAKVILIRKILKSTFCTIWKVLNFLTTFYYFSMNFIHICKGSCIKNYYTCTKIFNICWILYYLITRSPYTKNNCKVFQIYFLIIIKRTLRYNRSSLLPHL